MYTPAPSADEIFDNTLQMVAPLSCQERYMYQLAAIFSFHIKKNILIDEGFSVDDLPYQSAIIVLLTN